MNDNLNSILPEEEKPSARLAAEALREAMRSPDFMKEITKNAVIPVAKSDVEMLEELLSSETYTKDDEVLPIDEYDDEYLPFSEDNG